MSPLLFIILLELVAISLYNKGHLGGRGWDQIIGIFS